MQENRKPYEIANRVLRDTGDADVRPDFVRKDCPAYYSNPPNILNEYPLSDSPTPATPSVEEVASDLRRAVGDFASATSEKATAVKNRAVETAEALSATATDKAEHYKTVATEKAHIAKESAQQRDDDARRKAKEVEGISEDYIRQNPAKAILGALGVGFLISLIIRK
jgi:ElaB/YqjD/DUF883 family membrane-anchored ribosome-binding protein